MLRDERGAHLAEFALGMPRARVAPFRWGTAGLGVFLCDQGSLYKTLLKLLYRPLNLLGSRIVPAQSVTRDTTRTQPNANIFGASRGKLHWASRVRGTDFRGAGALSLCENCRSSGGGNCQCGCQAGQNPGDC